MIFDLLHIEGEKGLGFDSIQWGEGDSLQRQKQRADLFIFFVVPLFSHTPSSYLLFSASFPRFAFLLPFLLSHSVHLIHSITPPPIYTAIMLSSASRLALATGRRTVQRAAALVPMARAVASHNAVRSFSATSRYSHHPPPKPRALLVFAQQYGTNTRLHTHTQLQPGHTRKRRSRMKEAFSFLLTRLSVAHFALGRVQSLSANEICSSLRYRAFSLIVVFMWGGSGILSKAEQAFTS